ncbi:MAG: hypothetical protein ABRQ24_11080 [Syntrophomonadaceae bacterium]
MSETSALPPHDPEQTPIYHTVVRFLGVVTVLNVGGIIVLAVLGLPIPDALVALGSGSLGALAGVLAPAPGGKRK